MYYKILSNDIIIYDSLTMPKHLVILSNELNSTLRFRGSLIRKFLAENHRVTVVCPSGSFSDEKTLSEIGASHVKLRNMLWSNLNPRKELRLLDEISHIFTQLRPDRLYACGIKSVVWGAFATTRVKIPRSVGLIEGLGRAFSSMDTTNVQAIQKHFTRTVILQLLNSAMKKLDKTIVLNVDDFARLSNLNRTAKSKLSIIDGIGVDLDHFSPEFPRNDELRFTLAARLIEEKGIQIFAQLARDIRTQHPNVKFRLLGQIDPKAKSLQQDRIASWVNEGILEWPGHVDDVRPHLRDTSVFVLPTQYSEGLPRSIMEGMAMARPIITTDMPGARTALTDGISGFVVPSGSLSALAEACQKFIHQPELVRKMGAAALHEARCRFDLSLRDQEQMDLLIG